ncbi:MAG: hypothetical protein IPO86_10020 [Saprospiraceae bacterium]|nr:hypothetical protein [Saprospiraceae bacterium]
MDNSKIIINPKEEDLLSFMAKVELLANSKSPIVFPNRGSKFAAIVLGKIFSCAKNNVYIKANNFSGEISNEDNYIDGLKMALSKSVNFTIIVDDEKCVSINVSKGMQILLDYVDYGLVKIWHIKNNTDNINLNFCIADKQMFRYETESATHKAMCSFNDEKRTLIISNIFRNLLKESILLK